jgi:hypothetical protein
MRILVVVLTLKGQRNSNNHVPFVPTLGIEDSDASFLSRKEFEYFCPRVDEEN